MKISSVAGESFGDILKKNGVKGAIAVLVNGTAKDLTAVASGDETIEPIFLESQEGLKILRHSAAHLLAQAVMELYPDAKLNAGPATDDGFYYDIEMPAPTEEDLARIEERMHKLSEADYPIIRKEMSREELIRRFSGNRFKIDKVIANVPDGSKSTVYVQGDFGDFCLGPHVPSTGYIKYFKLLNVASTNYKGDEKETRLVRIYGTVFSNEKDLKGFLQNREEAAKRDHRKIGKEMDLFMFDTDVALGFPFYTPNGVIVRNELMTFMKGLNSEFGWEEVATPHVYRDILWKRSGHYAKYRPNMFVFTLDDGDSYGIKPMNCPGHIIIFQRSPKSYREMPVRYSEQGTVYRYEKSGEVGGLTRPRMFTQDDGHAFLRLDQVLQEVKSILRMVSIVYSTIFGKIDMNYDLSIIDKEKPDDFLISYICSSCGTKIEARKASLSDELSCPNCGGTDFKPDFTHWDQATDQLKAALKDERIVYGEKIGEAAFYGPKIDIHIKDALGRLWQVATIQIDFFMPINFGLFYVNQDGTQEKPVIVHRAIYGSYERFMAILIEHFAGKFPTWLSPLQAYIVPVSEKFDSYARNIASQLSNGGIRAKVDLGSETLNKKLKMIRSMRPSYILVVGEREEKENTVSVRNRKGEQKVMPVNEFIGAVLKEINEKNPVQTV